MRTLLLSVIFGAGCASSTPLASQDPWGWPVTTWQARHGNVLVLECVPPERLAGGVGLNDYVTSHGKKLQVFVEPPTRSILIAKHCERTVPSSAPGATPSLAMIYTPSVEQMYGIHRHNAAAHVMAHHDASHH